MDKTGAVETVDRISGILTDSDLDSVHRTDSPEPEGPCLVRKPTTDEGAYLYLNSCLHRASMGPRGSFLERNPVVVLGGDMWVDSVTD